MEKSIPQNGKDVLLIKKAGEKTHSKEITAVQRIH